jgi:hypothetical protein
MKLHFLYEHTGCLPSFLVVTDGRASDIRVAKDNNFLSHLLPDSILSIDRAYIDFRWLFELNKQGIFFVTRLKTNMRPIVFGQHTQSKRKTVLSD